MRIGTLLPTIILAFPILAFNAVTVSAAQGQSCANCHKKIVAGKFVHPAFSEYLREEQGCAICHSKPHADKKPSLSLVTPLPDLCFSCHDRSPFANKHVHAPVQSGDCSTCHSPHTSDNPFLLREPIPFLCPTCHPDKLDGKHVLSRYGIGNIHPVQGKRDPSRPKRELVCTSCHAPHAAAHQFLFPDDSSSIDALCLRCHRKVTVAP